MLAAEFLGTGILTLAVLSVQRSQLGLAYFVAIGAGLAVVALTYIFGNISGAHMNPALTIALWTARRIKTLPAIAYVVVQLLGAWAAYGLYRYFVNTEFEVVPQAYSSHILVAEAIATMVFALGWAAAAYNRVEAGRFAVMAGISYALAILIAGIASKAAIAFAFANPAVAEGVRAWEVFGENGWGNYVLGPVLGAIIGVNLYGLLFADPDRPFSALRGGLGRRTAKANAGSTAASTASESDDTDAGVTTKASDDEVTGSVETSSDESSDLSEEDEPIAKKSKSVSTSAAASKLAKAKKTTGAKKSSSKRKR
jgi:glycerol uptake facilitator-like aquaporin